MFMNHNRSILKDLGFFQLLKGIPLYLDFFPLLKGIPLEIGFVFDFKGYTF